MIMQYNFFTKFGVLLITCDFVLYVFGIWFVQAVVFPDGPLGDDVALLTLIQPASLLCIVFIVVTSLLPVFAVQQFDRWMSTKPHHVLEEINALGLEIVKPEARSSTIQIGFAGENETDDGADMLVKSDSLTHASDKIDEEETRLPTIVSEREIIPNLEEKA